MRTAHAIASAATALTLMVGPSAASAASIKWLTCQFYDSTKNKVIHLNNAFAMGGAMDLDKTYAGFLVAAKTQGVIDETSKTEGTCILSKTEEEALGGVAGFVKHYKAMGAREGTIGFAPN